MIAHMLNCQNCPFFNRQAIQIVIFNCLSHEQSIDWSIQPGCLLLNPIDVSQIFQILVTVVIVFHVFLYTFSQFRFYFWVLCNKINHGHDEMGSRVCPCHKERTELLQNFLVRVEIFITFGFRVNVGPNQSFNHIFWFFFHPFFLNSFSSNFDFRFNVLQAPIFEQCDSSIDVSVLCSDSCFYESNPQKHGQKFETLQHNIRNKFVYKHADRDSFQFLFGRSSQKALQDNTGKHSDSQVDDVIFYYMSTIFCCVTCNFFNVGQCLRADFFNFRSHRFYKVEIKNRVNNPPFSFPFFSFTKWYSPTHCSNNRGVGKFQFWICVKMLIRIKIPNEVWMAEIQNNPMDGVTQNDIIVPISSFANFKSVSFLFVFLNDVIERHSQWGEGSSINFIPQLLQLVEVGVVEFSGDDNELVDEDSHQDENYGDDVLFHKAIMPNQTLDQAHFNQQQILMKPKRGEKRLQHDPQFLSISST